ncbi:glycosyltransferase [Candidatus Bathyarchaeota archaeon]|nr:glycosyltransferase [Candidatus Bathyarchaeota archaeon]
MEAKLDVSSRFNANKKEKSICFIVDPLVTTAGAVRPALLLAREFHRLGYEVTIITLHFDEEICKKMQEDGVHFIAVGSKKFFIQSFPTFDAWLKCLVKNNIMFDLNRNYVNVINTSSTIIAPANVYYAQGLMIEALDAISRFTPLHYRCAYYMMRKMLKILERKMVKRIQDLSKLFIANSVFCASMYKKWGFKVDGIINPPLDCSFFKPSTSKPTADYVLTHFGIYGKEGGFQVIKAIADAGVTVKAFGDYSSLPKFLVNHANIEFLGRVSDKELVDLYSNALYTLFAFNHEPFGYVPVESMACGTPVLTYNRQGPSETVINYETGWLVNNDYEMVNLAINLWREGYDSTIRRKCRKRAENFDVKKIFVQWLKILEIENLCEQNKNER